MLLNAYTLYDNKALVYSPPFFASAHGQAVRLVMEVAQDTNTTVGRHPSDFTLYCIGLFDDAAGSLLSADVREHISDVLPLAPRRHPDFFGQPDSATNGAAK
ncbi:nonstructural protein [Blackfly microvirus SF02]|uniref:Nonstructural protein n=1 Tax=Blackfly microvirus SF02 TaxID=2576452 RepID=A0A4P8PS21_9VIRU|nr:nonstructural protein [Blackfly microvirus SF02]